MARTPTVDNFRTTTPAGRLPNLPEPDTAGFLAGAQTIKQGATEAGAVASAATQLYAKQLDDANRLRVIEATNEARRQANKLTYDPEEGYSHIKGGDVLKRESGQPLSVEYDGMLGERIDGIAGGLSNKAQREMFAEQAGNIRTAFAGNVEQHTANEYRTYTISTYAGQVKLDSDDIAANPNNLPLIEDRLANIDAAVAKVGGMNGKAPNEIASDQKLMRSKALGDAIQTAMDKDDWATATSLFTKYGGGLDANAVHAIQGPLQEGRRAEMTMSVLDTVDGRASVVAGSVVPTAGASKLTTAQPVQGGIQKGDFGDKRPGHIHNGEDWAVPVGTPVYAQLEGEVIRSWTDDTNGHAMKVRYSDGSVHGFGHLSEGLLPVGAKVAPGQVFAKTGNTGRSTGPHLHWTVEVGGKKMDPSDWAKSPGKPGATTSGNRFTGTTVEQYVDSAVTELKRRDPQVSVKDIDAVRREAVSRWSLHTASEREADEAATEAGMRHIANGGTMANMPAAVRNEIIRKNPAGLAQIQSYENTLRNPAPRDAKADDILYNKAVSDPQSIKGMDDATFNQVYAGHPQFTSIANYRAELQGKSKTAGAADPGNLDFATINTMVDQRLTEHGVDPKSTKTDEIAKMGAARTVINKAIAAEQARLGKPLNDVQMQDIIDKQFLRQAPADGWFSTSKQTALTLEYDDIPSADVATIEKRLRDRKQPITEQAVLETYMAWKGR